MSKTTSFVKPQENRRAAMATFNDLRRHIESETDVVSGPYTCYIGNAGSIYPWPRKFTYRGCTFMKGNKTICARSIEGHSEICQHNPHAEGNHCNLYRFEVVLFDANATTAPVYATVFDSAQKLLNMPADDFADLDESKQLALVHGATFQAPLFNVWIRSQGVDKIIINRLEKPISLDSPEAASYHTPTQHFHRFSSPRSASKSVVSGVGTSSESRGTSKDRRAVRIQDDSDSENWKKSLAKAMDILSTLSTRDT